MHLMEGDHSTDSFTPGGLEKYIMQADENLYSEGVDFVDYAQTSAKSFKSGCVEGSLEGTVRCDWINVNMDRPFGYYDD